MLQISNNMFHQLQLLSYNISPNQKEIQHSLTNPINADFLVGTCMGLLYYYKGKFYQILDGYCYGITYCHNRWYVFRTFDFFYSGHLISFVLEDKNIKDIRIELTLLPRSIHQIDTDAQDFLYIADTNFNRVLRYKITEKGLKNKRMFYPSGYRTKSNYVHLNSVFCLRDKFYVMYHNHSVKTGKNSQIAICDRNLKVQQIIDTTAQCGHNLAISETGFIYCNSLKGELIYDNKIIKLPEKDCFSRGLAISDNYIFVGGSPIAESGKREGQSGYIFVFNKQGKLVTKMTIPNVSPILEIRLVSHLDYGLSRTHNLDVLLNG